MPVLSFKLNEHDSSNKLNLLSNNSATYLRSSENEFNIWDEIDEKMEECIEEWWENRLQNKIYDPPWIKKPQRVRQLEHEKSNRYYSEDYVKYNM